MVHYCLKFLKQYLWRYFERNIGVIWRKICCLLRSAAEFGQRSIFKNSTMCIQITWPRDQLAQSCGFGKEKLFLFEETCNRTFFGIPALPRLISAPAHVVNDGGDGREHSDDENPPIFGGGIVERCLQRIKRRRHFRCAQRILKIFSVACDAFFVFC